MEFNVTAGTNSSSILSLIIAMEITNLILVVIPSVLLSSLLLYCLYKLKKVFVVRPLSFLYGCIAVIGIIMPISYRTALDVPLACNVLYDLAETDLDLLSLACNFRYAFRRRTSYGVFLRRDDFRFAVLGSQRKIEVCCVLEESRCNRYFTSGCRVVR